MDTAGDGGTQKVPVIKIEFVATVGDVKSPVFKTRQEARDWTAQQRSERGQHLPSTLDEVYE